jgi:hypothetical protein
MRWPYRAGMDLDYIDAAYRHLTTANVANDEFGDDADPRIGELVQAVRLLAIELRQHRRELAALRGEPVPD